MMEFADWDQFGRWAGAKRNKEMIDKYDPEAVIVQAAWHSQYDRAGARAWHRRARGG
jgi:hypothetical protein